MGEVHTVEAVLMGLRMPKDTDPVALVGVEVTKEADHSNVGAVPKRLF